ncbi:MAG: PQQ-dependent sugar dehydrogenase [Euryarchaeota archaeon]|nr:PQQ-dependent sugar dehydrogenase [Euryarchaeota archaeon]
MPRRVGPVLLAMVAAGCVGGPPAPPASDVAVALEEIATGLSEPVHVVATGNGSELWVVEQTGKLRALDADGAPPRTVLDLSSRTQAGGERGFLSVALDPRFSETGTFYVSYTDNAGDSVLARYRVGDGGEVEADSGETVLTQAQPFSNHNGGLALFGPDGYLYIGFGDGGGQGDPSGNGQKPSTWLGKLLRLNVTNETTYSVPEDNPFRAKAGWLPEIWAYGLRNPWRFSFDRATGDLWIADVGQWEWEEIDRRAAESEGGENYGWNLFEGSHRFRAGDAPDHVRPVYDYRRTGGHCAVTGGYVYRGEAIPALVGSYVFGDYCSGVVWTLTRVGESWEPRLLLDKDLSIASFGEDAQGEILVIDRGGSIQRIVAG